ncbi:hypothetical protein O0I10_012817 [Lichtheimia ornata]|uniref:Uncharacterized protein n=1 Tax=Lichtheimia ornata TaxID=688661 RepID=A0AAD7USS1_9FUNG|nr:uncharacterized protein O0I10_012817 [Lichtheimia ornata]KAJ8651611.1 hypothetical protein O0I10_012817 [Lichtheimia ornata]
MDLANYELSEKGNRNLLVLVDMCTRFCILRPLPDKEATTIVNTLVQIFCDVGLPKIIQSDNGKEFVNDLMKRFARASGFEHRLVLPYHPRANGSAERWVQKVTLCIKEMLKGATTNWDSYVPAVQLALNANVTSRHKTPPFTLMFARRHNDFKDYTNTPDSEPLSEEQLLERIHHMKDIVFPAIRESTKTITKRQEAYFNRKHKMTQYNIGDYVMVRSPELSSKFDATYKGPYQIINTTNAGTSYVLKNYEGEILPRNYPPQSLKPIQVLEHIPADEIYEIENIVGHKVHKGNFLYRVRWKGYSEDDDTWEPPQNFNDPSSITTYWRRRNENPQNILERLNLKRKSSNHSHANKKARYHLRNHQSY